MDHKSWLWRRRSSEKSLPAEKTNSSSRRNEDEENEATEVWELTTEKHDERSSSLSEDQIKIAHEAVEGWENAKKEAFSLKKDLEKALQQKASCEERLGQLDAALKECMKDCKRRIFMLEAENAQVKDSMLEKDGAIEELNRRRNEMEGDFNALLRRVKSYEKENASLKYEVCVLEKEVEIRNEEREFNRRLAAVAQKKQQESDRKIAKLENECQKLRFLVKKRLPGAADLAKMRKEVESIGKNQFDHRRRRSTEILMEQLHMVEEENRRLKRELEKKPWHVKKSVKGGINKEKNTYPIGNFRDDDEVSCAESWASALLSELDQFRSEKELRTPSRRTIISTSEINLLDDFTEMEKLAVVSVDYTAESSHHSSDEGVIFNRQKKALKKLKVSEPIQKIVDLLGGINIASEENKCPGYLVRVLQWKASEMSSVMKSLIQMCNDLLHGTGDLQQFVQVVASSLEWVVNHCFSIQDVPTMKYGIRNQLEWDEMISEAEVDTLSEKCQSLPYVPLVSPLRGLSAKESAENENEGHNESSIMNLGDGNESQIENLRSRMRSMRLQSEDRTNDQKMVTQEFFNTHLSETSTESRAVGEDIPKLEDEEKKRSNSREMLGGIAIQEAKDDADYGNYKVEELQKQDWEVTAASEKLAECQETLRNLGIQLKALASSPGEASLPNEVKPTEADADITGSISNLKESITERFSLLDKMAEREHHKTGAHSMVKDDIQDGITESTVGPNTTIDSSNEVDGDADKVPGSSLAVVQLKKKNGTVSFLKKLFRRKKRSRKTLYS